MEATAAAIPTIIDALPSRGQVSVAKMPDPKQKSVRLQDLFFRAVARFFAFFVLAILLGIIVSLVYGSLPAMQKFGFGFLVDSEWNPVTERFGALVPIVGTLGTSFIALLIGVPVSFGIALFLTELSPAWLKRPLGTAIELLAAIPSIIYGMWGLFVLAPLFADHVQPWLINTLGSAPFFGAMFKGPPQGIGVFTAEEAVNYGLTGGTLRGSGVNYDIRKVEPYAAYDKVEFDVPLGTAGDVYDRYIVRINEMRQSNRIIKQCLDMMQPGTITTDDPRYAIPEKLQVMQNMQSLVHQFVLMSKWVPMPKGEVYVATEAPKGELGFFIVSDGAGRPYRIKIRAPSYVHVSALPKMVTGHMVADVIACIGTIDIVLGEVDR